MRDLFVTTIKRLKPVLLKGDIEACEREIAGEIQKLPASRFHIVIDLSINNDPVDAAAHFDRFFDLESKRFQIGAAYTEMNGFSINPRRWYCDLIAYSADGGHDNYSWLCEWESKRFPGYTITGLEPLQQVYAANQDKVCSSAAYMSSLMVVVKFQRFMQRASSHMKLLRFPLYVTAHDFDFIASFDPRPEPERTPVRKVPIEEQIDAAIAKLEADDYKTRGLATLKLSTLGPSARRAVPAIIELLSDAHPGTRQAAAIALSKLDPTSDTVVSALLRCLEQDPRANVRQEVIGALAHSPTRAAVLALANALFDEDATTRYNAAISLKVLGANARDAAPALRKLLETESDENVRGQATVALERMSE